MTEAPDPLSPSVTTDWLARNLDNERVVVLDASWYLPEAQRDPKADFEERRIPGAVFFDVDAIIDHANPVPRMAPGPQAFANMVGELGIDNDSLIVVYDTHGLYSAARGWWMFKSYGHQAVWILAGGLPRWIDEARPTESGSVRPRTPRRFVTDGSPATNVVDAEGILASLGDGRWQILDARTPGRFSGSQPDPYEGLRSGHIPGSINLHWATVLDEVRRELLPPDVLRERLASAGIDPERPSIVSCGGGITACLLAAALTSMGNRDWRVYDGSWNEWGTRHDLPIEV